jgi:hypothetical protein
MSNRYFLPDNTIYHRSSHCNDLNVTRHQFDIIVLAAVPVQPPMETARLPGIRIPTCTFRKCDMRLLVFVVHFPMCPSLTLKLELRPFSPTKSGDGLVRQASTVLYSPLPYCRFDHSSPYTSPSRYNFTHEVKTCNGVSCQIPGKLG